MRSIDGAKVRHIARHYLLHVLSKFWGKENKGLHRDNDLTSIHRFRGHLLSRTRAIISLLKVKDLTSPQIQTL